jgi:hypothetical protein
MPFIGKQSTSGFASLAKQTLTADGSTTVFTLNENVASANSVEVFVGNVRQEPSVAYTTSGNQLTFTAAPASGVDVYVIFQGGLRESETVPQAGTTVPGAFGVSDKLGVGTSIPSNYTVDIKRIGGGDRIVRIGSDQGQGRTLMFADVHSSPTKYNFQIGTQSNVNNGFEITPSTTIGGTTFSNPAITVDENGYVKKPTQPMFEAVGANSAYISIATHGNVSPVPFPTVRHNIGNHYDNTTYAFTAPVAGRYFFTSSVYTRTGQSGTVEDIFTRFKLNGSANRGYAYWYQVSTAGERHHTLTDTLFIELAANDYIQVYIQGTSTADFYNGPEETRFSGWLVG